MPDPTYQSARPPAQLTTHRLVLRRWLPNDRGQFAALNADPRVMAHFPRPLTAAESDEMVDRIERHFDTHGFGLWAIEPIGGGALIGFAGLSVPSFDAPFMPAVEVGWRLGRAHWGRGVAAEAARAALDDGFGRVGLAEVVAMTVAGNRRSRRLMERLGMSYDPIDDFDHPRLDGAYRRHVLYRLARSHHLASSTGG